MEISNYLMVEQRIGRIGVQSYLVERGEGKTFWDIGEEINQRVSNGMTRVEVWRRPQNS